LGDGAAESSHGRRMVCGSGTRGDIFGGMAVVVEMQHTGCVPVVRSEIAAIIDHALADRPGDWRVLIVGSEANDLAFFDFFPSDLCVWQGCSESATLFPNVPCQGIGSMDAPFAMVAHSKVFIVARNQHIVPKQRRVERLPSGYSIREFYNHPQGRYWYVVTALEVKPTNKCPR
jgi:hypothetical protein